MFAFLVPITGIALSSLFFDEPIRLTLVAGGFFVLAGVYVATPKAFRSLDAEMQTRGPRTPAQWCRDGRAGLQRSGARV